MQALFAGVLLTDAQGCLTWANANVLVRCGCTLAELQGWPLGSLPGGLPLDEATKQLIVRALAHGDSFHFDLPDPCPSQTGGWLRIRMQPIYPEEPAPRRYVGLVEDVSTEKQAQLALAESERRYRELAEQVPGVLYRWRRNLDGTATSLYTSPKLQELFGLAAADLHSLYSFLHPDDKPRYLRSVAVAKATGHSVPWHFEGRLLVPGQPLRWWRGHATLSHYSEQGAVYSAIIQDNTAARQAEETTRRSQLRQQLALEGLSDSTWEFDCQAKTMSNSSELHPLLAYSAAELPGLSTNPSTFTHPHDLAPMLRRWQDCLAGRTPFFSSEHRLRCHDGSYRWVLSRGVITQRDAQGQPLRLTGLNIDISARKQAEADLLAAALRLSATIDSLHRGVLLVDEQQRIVQANGAFCTIFGLSIPPERLVGLTDLEAAQLAKHNFPDEEAFLQYVQYTIAQREQRFDDLVVLRGGQIIQRYFVPVWQGENNIGHLWKFEDITERYYAEQTLKRQEEKYRNIIDNMQLGLVEMDLDHRVLYANRSYCQMVGYTEEELHQQPLPPLILRPEALPLLRAQLPNQQGLAGSYELEITTKQGERKWLFVGAAALYNEEKQPVGTICINLDITHQKHLEQNLREAKQQAEDSARVKELFLANMSHEIRTPMNAILGMSQLLAKTPLAPRQSNFLHAITTSAQNLLVIINDILDISKLDAGKMTIERVGFNVARLCEQVEKTLHYKAEEKGLRLVTRVDPLIPDVVLGDPYRLTQVLLNLASNSVKFTEKGTILLTCEVAGYLNGQVFVAFSVADTGIGIDAAYLDHIFQDFSQGDTSVTRKFGGTGLGLSISRSLVQLMGCDLTIESEKNRGTTAYFCLCLPTGTVADLPQRRSATIANPQELRGKQVLLVEDNEYNRLLAKTFLTNADLRVTEAENGEEAIARVREQVFDLILMDVQMPVLDGFETTLYLRHTVGLTTPIIALTASAIHGEKQKCLAVGMNDYLTKPFYEDELLQLVHDWVARPPAGMAALPAATLPAAVPPAASSHALYKLDILFDTAKGNQKFVQSMLQTFIDGTYTALRDLNRALEVGSVQALQATAHKLRPSLMHLQIQPAVALMDSLENWEGAYSYDDIQPLVEAADRLLRQVLADMGSELATRRNAAAG
jgi:PAS domain S-box-containing protein